MKNISQIGPVKSKLEQSFAGIVNTWNEIRNLKEWVVITKTGSKQEQKKCRFLHGIVNLLILL